MRFCGARVEFDLFDEFFATLPQIRLATLQIAPAQRRVWATRQPHTVPPFLAPPAIFCPRFCHAMARVKAAATRARGDSGVRKPGAQAGAALASGAARTTLANRFAATAPTHIYTSPTTGARGEVLLLPPPPLQHHQNAAAGRGRAHTHIVFLPGNPGVVECYRRWLCELADRLPLDVRSMTTIHGLGYPGHDVRELNGKRLFGITDFALYVAEYLRSRQVDPPLARSSHVVFIGHSFGSFLSLRVLNADTELAARAHLVMLMPAVHKMADCRPPVVRLITNEAAGAVLVPLVNAVAHLAPRAAIRAAVDAIGIGEDGAIAAIGRMFDGRRAALYTNCLSLAREEMVEIHDPGDEPASRLLGPERSYLYWTERDTWCTAESVAAIRKAFGPLTVQSAPSEKPVSHAFSTDVSQLETVARCVASWVTGISRDGPSW
jgi:pimeloyl-ACP methyl ester carboxylesterase